MAAEDGPVVGRLRPELEAVPRTVAHRRVGRVRPLAVAVPGEGGERVAAVGEADQCHEVSFTDGLTLGVALDFWCSRRI